MSWSPTRPTSPWPCATTRSARALYWTTNLNQEIPGPLYVAVAQVLTYVYRVKAAVQSGAPWPERPAVQVDAGLATPRRGRRGPQT